MNCACCGRRKPTVDKTTKKCAYCSFYCENGQHVPLDLKMSRKDD